MTCPQVVTATWDGSLMIEMPPDSLTAVLAVDVPVTFWLSDTVAVLVTAAPLLSSDWVTVCEAV